MAEREREKEGLNDRNMKAENVMRGRKAIRAEVGGLR